MAKTKYGGDHHIFFHWIAHSVKLRTIIYQIIMFTWLEHQLFPKTNNRTSDIIIECNDLFLGFEGILSVNRQFLIV